MIVLVDMDGVAVNLYKVWAEMYNRDYDDNLKCADVTTYNMENHVKPECGERMTDYLKVKGLYLNAPPYHEAETWLTYLRDMGCTIFFVTAPYLTEYVHWEKLQWVEKHFPWVGQKRVPLVHPKWMVRGDVLIDDYSEHLMDFQGERILMTRPWNKSFNEKPYGITRCNNWVDIVGRIEVLQHEAAILDTASLENQRSAGS